MLDRRSTGLWRNADFLKLWMGQTVSAFGSMFGALGLTALVYLDASVPQMGVLAMAQGLPVLLFALVAGAWIDRLRRRPILIACDLGRAALLLTVPVAALLDALRIEQLYAVAFAVGLLGLAFEVAYRSYLPDLVAREEILEGNAKLQASESIAEVGSPATGGAMVQAVGGPAAVFVDALTFIWSAVCVALIRRQEERSSGGDRAILAEVKEGMGAIWNDRALRALTAAGGTFRFFGGFFQTLYGVFLIRTLGLSPLLMGITIGAGGVGSFAGALFAAPMTRRLGLGATIVASRLAFAPFGVLIPLAGGPKEVAFAMIVVAQACGDPFWATYDIATVSLRQSITPTGLLGRVTSGMHVVQAGLEPGGALVAGMLAGMIGVRETLWVAVAGGALGIFWLLLSPIPRMNDPIALEPPAADRPQRVSEPPPGADRSGS